MTYLRKNVWNLGSDWADPILWYARGVKAMQSRALDDRNSWRFYAAIHGFKESLWRHLGYLDSRDRMPSTADIQAYWKQCQHGSWYFLPWHRGYLLAFEAVVRDEVIKLHGPKDWALPYWNYFEPGEDRLPKAFASPDWPDGKGNNPLYVKQRYGPYNNSEVYVPISLVNQNALGDPDFEGVASGGGPGFGGVCTGFHHSRGIHGGIETQPHDAVHGIVGGRDPLTRQPGLMSNPDIAGLDPIFWLHHANIDRLWEVWRRHPPTHVDPTKVNWLKGPAFIGERPFKMPMPHGDDWTYTPGEMSNLSKLGYAYDDVSAPPKTPPLTVARLNRLRTGQVTAETLEEDIALTDPKIVELFGASDRNLAVKGAEARSSVTLDAAVQRKISANLTKTAAATSATPDRVFLNLENVRGLDDATILSVYINVPEGGDPAKYPDHLAGSVALFGVSNATAVGEEGHAGDGLTFVVEISHMIDALHLAGALPLSKLDVRLVALTPVAEESQVSIGRISVYRQST
ncbi:tyrosinase family protein [Burkholderia sp. BDU5]|uniref:tyrosinase family protein n=1 Tax=Burkholderia sp. BDU5 TaxID=1385590 RepID=UPI00075BB42A|nr:tyrosinase family protein [Burkholderia sp. BDU5]KVE38588.1 tyrosinase [Burkholderia sp. BDU5]